MKLPSLAHRIHPGTLGSAPCPAALQAPNLRYRPEPPARLPRIRGEAPSAEIYPSIVGLCERTDNSVVSSIEFQPGGLLRCLVEDQVLVGESNLSIRDHTKPTFG
ncbi:hypothetical protein POX_d05874 [Penicillium oxalicum]|uniref:hypothetical protein n=1 Tax=Penicillium oxalicum TaxID=69781 RepID=UPI0020B866E6|nr:hypothetical protein POX_d05874 [Penicillium oxalicum]KAI2790363.1 hypothetical protein POX_d05874 [Penicillium oxalicum]